MKPLDQSGLWKIASLLLDDPPDLSISIVRGLKNLFLISIKKKHRHRRNIITAFFSCWLQTIKKKLLVHNYGILCDPKIGQLLTLHKKAHCFYI